MKNNENEHSLLHLSYEMLQINYQFTCTVLQK